MKIINLKLKIFTILRNDMILSSDVGAVIIDSLNETRYEIGNLVIL